MAISFVASSIFSVSCETPTFASRLSGTGVT